MRSTRAHMRQLLQPCRAVPCMAAGDAPASACALGSFGSTAAGEAQVSPAAAAVKGPAQQPPRPCRAGAAPACSMQVHASSGATQSLRAKSMHAHATAATQSTHQDHAKPGRQGRAAAGGASSGWRASAAAKGAACMHACAQQHAACGSERARAKCCFRLLTSDVYAHKRDCGGRERLGHGALAAAAERHGDKDADDDFADQQLDAALVAWLGVWGVVRA